MKVHAGDGSSEAGGSAVVFVIAEVDDVSFLTLSSMGISCIIIDAPDSS
jgi:hypothetical protein